MSSPPQTLGSGPVRSPSPMDVTQGPATSTSNVMRYEERRLSTFQDWPANAKVDARKIAKAGFHHTGSETRVQCSWCGCVLSDWNYGDQVRKSGWNSCKCTSVKRNGVLVPKYIFKWTKRK